MIELQHLVKTYDAQLAAALAASGELDSAALPTAELQRSGVYALRDVSLSVAAGEIFAVIGKSGAGKSTLLRVINQLERQDRGRVTVAGHDLQTLSAPELRRQRRQIGMIFQGFNLLDVRTVQQNIALALQGSALEKQVIAQRVSDLLDLVGLADKADVYPDQLSGGQKQRVAIARALVTEPKILLCDEATSALDAESTTQILSLLQQIRDRLGVTIFLITHELDVVRRICDRVAVLDQGQIVEQGQTLDVLLHPQHVVTQRLVAHALEHAEAEALTQLASQQASPALHRSAETTHYQELLRLVYVGKETDKPLLSELQRQFGVAINILQAKIENISGSRVGFLLCHLIGAKASVQQAKDFLGEHGIEIQSVQEGGDVC